MQRAYRRRYPRDQYESMLVGALNAIGYQLRLSSDFEDEILGFDAIDEEFGLRIDFHIGPRNERFYAKLAKQNVGKIFVFHIDLNLHDELCLTRCGRKAMERLAEAYESFLEKSRTLVPSYN